MSEFEEEINLKKITRTNYLKGKNKNIEMHNILISPIKRRYNSSKSPHKPKPPINLAKSQFDINNLILKNSRQNQNYSNSLKEKQILNLYQNPIIDSNNILNENSKNKVILPIEKRLKKKTTSDLFDRNPNFLVKRRNFSANNLNKQINENKINEKIDEIKNEKVKNELNNEPDFSINLYTHESINKRNKRENELILQHKKYFNSFDKKEPNLLRYSYGEEEKKLSPSKINLIPRDKSSINVIPKIKLKPLTIKKKSFHLLPESSSNINSKLILPTLKKTVNFSSNIKFNKNYTNIDNENKDVDTSNNLNTSINTSSNINSNISKEITDKSSIKDNNFIIKRNITKISSDDNYDNKSINNEKDKSDKKTFKEFKSKNSNVNNSDENSDNQKKTNYNENQDKHNKKQEEKPFQKIQEGSSMNYEKLHKVKTHQSLKSPKIRMSNNKSIKIKSPIRSPKPRRRVESNLNNCIDLLMPKQREQSDKLINTYSKNVFENASKISFAKTFIKSHISITQAGREEDGLTKINQDSYLELTNINNNPNFNIFGVFDGHGSKGHLVSQFIVNYLKNYFTSENSPFINLSYDEIYNTIKKDDYNFIKKLLLNSEEKLLQQKDIDSNFSGTTCNLIIHINNKIICSNIGDSRSIMVKSHKTIIQLSYDQKPDDEEERKRIEENNGEIHKLYDEIEGEIGPLRIWKKGEKYPGITISRSIGDKFATKLGVICLPDIKEFDIDIGCKFIVCGSDGIWEVLSHEKVAHYVNKFYKKLNVEDAAWKLVKKSKEMWEKEDTIIDDITVIVIFLNEE